MATELTTSDQVWKGIGKLATVIGVILGLAAVYNLAFPREPNVSAACSVNSYEESPEAHITAERVRNALLEVSKIRGMSFPVVKDLDAIAKDISDSLENPLLGASKLLERNSEIYVECQVHNGGASPAENVVLDFESQVYFFARLPDGKGLEARGRSATLGSMRPDATVLVQLWGPQSWKFLWHDPTIRLSHRDGKGSVDFDVRVTGIGAFLARYFWGLFFGGIFGAALLLMLLAGIVKAIKPKGSVGEGTNSGSKVPDPSVAVAPPPGPAGGGTP